MSTVILPKSTICLTAAIAIFLASFGSIKSANGQQLDHALAHVDGETSIVVRVDSKAFDTLLGTAKQKDKGLGETVLQQRLQQTRKILAGDPIWLTVGFPLPPFDITILVRDPEDKRIEELKDLWDFPNNPEHSFTIKPLSAFPTTKPADAVRLEQWKQLMAPAKDALNGESTIQFACLPPAHLYDTYRELNVTLPDYLGGGPATLLTDGLRSVSGSINLNTGMLGAAINSASPAAATAFADRATELVNRRRAAGLIATAKQLLNQQGLDENENLQARPIVQQFDQSTFKAVNNQVRWRIPGDKDWQSNKMITLLVGPVANRSATKRLRNLALGILNYESAHGHFPPPTESRGPDAATGLSWRVHILPFFGESNLYQRFALDEPWDSETNLKLLPEMPAIYSDYGAKLLAPVNAKPGYTSVVAPMGDKTILGSPKRVTFSSISDGTSNTILLVVVKDSLAVPWTAPQDYVFDRDEPAAGLKFTNGKTPVVFGDGSSRFLIENNTWLRLFEMNDGNVAVAREN
jgi:hypothetical protein